MVAPATDIIVAAANGNLYSLCDSSAADVWLTSTAVLIKSVYPHLPPGLAARAIAMSARGHPPHGFSPALGFGMINPVGALRAAARLAHLQAVASPGPGNAAPAARLAPGPAPGPVTAVQHSLLKLAACAGAIAAGIILLAAAAVVARWRRAPAGSRAGAGPVSPGAPVSPAG